MENIFKQAREFANTLLETKEGKAYTEAKYIFEGNEDAVSLLNVYAQKTQSLQIKINNGELEENLKDDKEDIKQFVEKIKKEPILVKLFEAEDEFNALVGSVMDIFNQTLSGKEEQQGGCSGGCGSCGGCH